MGAPPPPSAPPTLQATCTPTNWQAGSPNPITLSLSVAGSGSGSGSGVSLTQGDMIALLNLPTGWTVTPTAGETWQWSASSQALVWQGDAPFTIGTGPTTLALLITPAGATGSTTQITLQILDSAGDQTAPLSTIANFLVSLTPSAAPFLASPQGNATVILSASGAVPFQNSIECALLAQNPPAAATPVAITVSLHAWDADGRRVDASKSINTGTIAVQGSLGGQPVTFASGGMTWTTSLTCWGEGLANALSVVVSNLQVTLPDIAYLEMRFSCAMGNDITQTSAVYATTGPFAIALMLDPGDADSSHFCILTTPQGFAINAFFRDIAQGIPDSPSLIPSLVNSQTNQEANYPVAGAFSWASDQILFPSDYDLKASNTLYWCVPTTGDAVAPVVSCSVTLTQLTPSTPAPLSFVGMDLHGFDFSGWSNLAGADFTDADLAGCNLKDRNLEAANFTGANLDTAILRGATLTNAILSGDTSLLGVVSSDIRGTPAPLPPNWSLVSQYLIGPGADLTWAELGNADLTNADLTGANLTNAQLPNANLTNANLTNANLTHAQLAGATISGATFTQTTLLNVRSGSLVGTPSLLPSGWSLVKGYLIGPGANLGRATLSNADLTGAILTNAILDNAQLDGATLANANLAGASLNQTNLEGATLTGVMSGWTQNCPINSLLHLPAGWQCWNGYLIGPSANLTSADLAGANLNNADLSNANLTSANLAGASLSNANLSNANLTSANLAYATLDQADLSNAILTSANLSAASFGNTNLAGTNLTNSTMVYAQCKEIDLSSATLTGATIIIESDQRPNALPANWQFLAGSDHLAGPGANLSGANLVHCALDAVNLSGANLANANLAGAQFGTAILSNANLANANLSFADLGTADLTNANLTGATFQGTRLDTANLTNATLTGVVSGGCRVNSSTLPSGWTVLGGYLMGPGANLANVNLSGRDLGTVDLTDANLTDANLQGANLADATLTGATITNINLIGASLPPNFPPSP